MIDNAPNTTGMVGKELPSPHWGRWFRSLSDWMRSRDTREAPTAWTPVVSAETGTATKQGTFARAGSIVYFTMSITPSGAWSVTAGASVALPVQGIASGGVVIQQSGTSLGAAQVDGANLVLPSLSTSAPLTISGAYLGG